MAGEHAARVHRVEGSVPVEVVARIPRTIPIEPIDVNIRAMDQEFLEGIEHFAPMYRQILDPENYQRIQQVATALQSNGAPDFPPGLWARILYDFLFVYQVWNRNRRRLVDILVPLHFGRLGAYCRAVADLEDNDAEQLVERQAEAFEEEKKYLLERWS